MSKSEQRNLLYYTKNYWQYVVLLILIFTIISMRSQAMNAPATDTWAESTINQNILQDVTNKVNLQYPNLPQTSKQTIINREFESTREANKVDIEIAKKQLSQQYKDLISYEYNGKKYIYLGDIDSYFWLRHARNIDENGFICDEVIDGECRDKFALAPVGRKDTPSIHPYAIFSTFKISQFLGFDIPLMHASMVASIIIAVLVAIFAYFAGFFLYGKITGLVSAMIVSFNVMHLSRTLGSDDDGHVLLFPMIILAFLFFGIQAKKNKRFIVGISLAGIFTGLYRFGWQGGWSNIYNAVNYAFIMYIGFLIVHEYWITKDLKKTFTSNILKKTSAGFGIYYASGFVGYLISSLIMKVPVLDYFSAILQPLWFFRFAKAALTLNIWPNVLTTVAEFNALPLVRVPAQVFANSQFAKLLFYLGFLGVLFLITSSLITKKTKWWLISYSVIIPTMFVIENIMKLSPFFYVATFSVLVLLPLLYVVYKKQKISLENEHHLFAGMVLLIWFAGTLLATSQGIRFALLVASPIALAIGVALNLIYKTIMNLFETQYEDNVLNVISVIIISILLLLPATTALPALSLSQNYVPSYNAAWDSTLLKIKEESQPDAIVNSWWDYGHWFKYTTDRGVTLDGATQGAPALHWLGKTLLTNDEKLARGILRMLDCGSNFAFDAVLNSTNDTPLSVDIINEIIVIDDIIEVRKVLSNYDINESSQENILQYSHCNPPENYFITSNDMVGKGGVWAHFGKWDFYKAEIAKMKMMGFSKDKIISNISQRYFRNKTSDDVNSLYREFERQRTNEQINTWIADWPSFMGESDCQKSSDSYICQNGAIFNTTSQEVYFMSGNSKAYPNKFMYIGSEGIIERSYTESLASADNQFIGLMMIQNEQNYNISTVVVMHPDLVGSMFTRLYYAKGHGLKYFDFFDYKFSPLNTIIYTWKSDWEGKTTIDIYGVSTNSINI
jgi:asparagine N-glycosylation enzyme membrane subunit Stt3